MTGRSWLRARLRSASELRALARDSYYVGLWQGSTAVAELVQIALITHALGLAEYGRLALVIAFATLVSQLFDVRVGTSATIFAARELTRSPERAAGIMQFNLLVDALTGGLGFAAVLAAAALLGAGVVGGAGFGLVALYGLVLLASTIDESSMTVLRLLDRFKLIALCTVVIEGLRIALVAGALAVFGTLTSVVVALLAARLVGGGVYATAAATVFRRAQGRPLTRLALAGVREERRAMLAMTVHSSVVSYARITQVQLPTLLLGGLAGTTQVGIYKVGMAAAASVGKLADTAYVSFLPRFTRLWSGGRRAEARRLIRQASLIAVPAMTIAVLALVVLRDPILRLLGGGPAATAAGGVLIAGAIGQAINGAVFWNVGVLFASGHAAAMSKISIVVAVAQLAMLAPLILAFEATGAALSVCLSSALANAITTVLARRALRSAAPAAGATTTVKRRTAEPLP